MPNLDGQLTLLDTRGLVQRAAAAHDLEYLFRHALIQDAAYGSLLRADRRRLHEQVAAILEDGEAGGLDEVAPVLAHHCAAAGDAARARAYYERAGAHALGRFSNQEAAAHYRAALDLAAPAADQARLLAGLGQALVSQSQFAEGIATWRAAVAAYQAEADGEGLARAYAALAFAIFGAGDPPGAVAICTEALAALAIYPESPGRAVLLNETARAYLFTGHPAEAQQTARQAQALAAQYGDHPTQIAALITIGATQARTPAAARATLEQAVALADGADLPALARLAHHHLGVRFVELGAIRTARVHFQRAATLAGQTGYAALELFAGVMACYCTIWLGEWATAAADLPRLQHLAASIDSPTTGVRFLRLAAAALRRYQGPDGAALPDLEAVMAEAWSTGDLLFQIASAWEVSALLLEQRAWDRAQTLLEAVIPMSDRDVLFGRAWPRYRLSRVAAGTGDLATAHRLAAEADTLAGAAPLLPDQVEAARAAADLAGAEGRWPAAQQAYAAAGAALAQMGKHWERARTLQAAAAAAQAASTPAWP
ncbi:MAG TPA: hypothetical protein VKY74_11350 [Chloroflexia bacterium]|nr:hypothetical protein [Chloroflexia bacterium]